jgi:hypothetical protein
MTRPPDLTFAGAIDMALRFGAKLPDCREDSPLAALWIARIADLPLAQQQGRLAAAVIEANGYC